MALPALLCRKLHCVAKTPTLDGKAISRLASGIAAEWPGWIGQQCISTDTN
jgi:hypothetical protein